MDSTHFRNLLLLLKEDFQDKDIPHRTTMRKYILEMQKRHAENLSADMLVSFLICYLYKANCFLE